MRDRKTIDDYISELKIMGWVAFGDGMTLLFPPSISFKKVENVHFFLFLSFLKVAIL